jgi:hypothetical protein
VLALAATLVAALALTNLSDGRKLVVEQPQAQPAKAIVLLIPGGDTLLALGADGSTRSFNFVMRVRGQLQSAGYATAYLDDPTNLKEPIASLRALGRPIVLLSTSRGTITAAKNALDLGAGGPDAIVLTSPVTVGTRLSPGSLADVNVRALAMPTLVTANEHDTCVASPPDQAARLVSRIGPKATFVSFSSTALRGDPCQAMSPHGYLGIEDSVVAKITEWIAALH